MSLFPVAHPIRVLIVTDRLPTGESLAIALDDLSDVTPVGVAQPMTAAASVSETRPDVVVIDSASQLNGVGDVRAIAEHHPETRIILVVDPWLLGHLQPVVDSVMGLCSSSSSLAELIGAIRAVAQDESFVDPSLVERIVIKLGARGRPAARPPRALLSSRELEVVAGLADGLGITEIADLLGVSAFTVRGHVRNLLKKLGVHTQLQAVVVAQRMGLIQKR